MYKTIILSIILMVFSLNIQAGSRFSMEREYELMKSCIGNTSYYRPKIKTCACALAKTKENGWRSDYDDEKYLKETEKFNKSLSKNIKKCR